MSSIFTYLKKQKNKSNQDYTLNSINKGVDNIFNTIQPEIFTMAKENNIACKYGSDFLVTKDGNLTIGIELAGTSYAGLSLDNEISYLQNRIAFFTALKSDFELNIVIQKKKIADSLKQRLECKNIYANEVIQKWTTAQNIFKISYYLFISTTTKNITGFLEGFKSKATTEQENKNGESFTFNNKISQLKDLIIEIKNKLNTFNPRQMSGDEILNFYATYSNAQDTNLKYTYELISDCYISSDVEFKKDYIEFHRNDGSTAYARFISIKAYETEGIKSMMTTDLIRNNNEFMVFIHLRPFEKEKAIKRIKEIATFKIDAIKDELYELIEQIKADRENLVEMAYSVYLLAPSLDELETKTNDIKAILENQGLNIVRETINQKPLYFSFFPSRGNLNARKKPLKVSNLSTIVTFENEETGFNKNDWGDEAVTSFKHINQTPFLFNFHWQENGDRPSGHTMIIGGTGAGKTTIAQFLMLNCYKYNIDIFSMDKLRGMYNFATYTDGEYHDSDGENKFELNPFSLPNTNDNKAFLKSWLAFMAKVDDSEHEAISEISKTIERIYSPLNDGNIMTLKDFIQSLPANDNTNLKLRFENYKDSIFDNENDALNFTKQLSILNMDGILNDPKIAGLTAMYIFHKLKNQAKNNTTKRGFLCFIDELKDYLNDETMSEKILEAILEVRKIGGVMVMGFQSMSLFENMQRGSSFLDNIANYIIYPTNSEQTIQELTYSIGLTETEANFLRTTPQNSRQVLLKQRLNGKSCYLDLDLSRLNNHLRIFSSSSDNVMLMKRLKAEHPTQWRNMYLNY
ncbi:type IV secretion system DNA-binding domain-containing protein [Campylobacter sp. faydin G-140]|uniref:VirB4 family type IV secretion/conjugal transfer ATPase n=1 Tax=Campylobacter anatolicus TaxID=2829105 RepID=UPI001B9BB01E|nr:type IV secretion system DNA-binding domain-containing protein [Campylobacter anatolicus]MBR8466531.1 type IV secretion system DNA-binding domain-containing protein [Campylobacter anatolicus]